MAVGADAEEGNELGPVLLDLRYEAFAAGGEFGWLHLLCRRSRAIDEVGDAVAVIQELALLRRMEQATGEAGRVQCRPEAVSGAGEVMTRGGRVQARINSDEQDVQAMRDYVPKAFSFRGEKLRLARP